MHEGDVLLQTLTPEIFMATTSRLQVHTPSTNGHDKRPSVGGALEAVREAGSVAQTKIIAAAGSTEKVVKLHPLTSVGIALGGGILLGAIAAKAFSHTPTLAETVHERLGLKRWIARSIQGWL